MKAGDTTTLEDPHTCPVCRQQRMHILMTPLLWICNCHHCGSAHDYDPGKQLAHLRRVTETGLKAQTSD